MIAKRKIVASGKRMEFDQWFNTQLAARPIDPIHLAEPVRVADLPTPALLLDEVLFEANLARMAQWSQKTGIALRPHSKMHKSPVIAHRQLALGAAGICCAKVSEAEVMQRAGIKSILITSPVVDPQTITRVAQLARANPELIVVVDHPVAVARLEACLAQTQTTLKILIDIDPGLGRTGIAPTDALLALLQVIERDCPHLVFFGLQTYAGHCMHIPELDKRKSKYQRALAAGAEARSIAEGAGYPVQLMSGGGTGSIDFEAELGVLNELQAGSYAFMDIEYRDIESENGPTFEDFSIALTVLVTLISQPKPRAVTVDAGFKSLASDKMPPQFKDVDGLNYYWGGDEHGIVALDNPSKTLQLGDKLELLTPHCDPTVNLHDYYYVVRDGYVQELWPISTRGCSQ
jgi:3-hydroxy-D-aspartate aldolase